MTKKKKIIISVIIILIVVVAIKTYISGVLTYKFYLLSSMDEKFTKEIRKNIKDDWFLSEDSGPLPPHLVEYVLSDSDLYKLDESDGPFNKLSQRNNFNEIYNSDWQADLLKKIDSATKKVSDLKLETIKKDLIPSTKELMKASKDIAQPSIEESSSWPLLPRFRSIRNIAKYWCVLSRILEKDNDFDSSLLLSHSIFYMAKDFDTNYKNSRSLISKAIIVSTRNLAYQSMLIWAQKPKPQSKKLSKIIAKDILDFVKYDYPISNTLKYEEHLMDNYLDAICVTFGYGMKSYKDSYYQERKKELFKDPLEFIDKPYIEIEKKLSEYKPKNDNIEESIKNDPSFYLKMMFFNTRKIILDYVFSMASINLKKYKENYETDLSKMEMVAIALAINSYYCEKNKLPASMDELSQWFGEELPINRFTGKPYELKPNGKYILSNEGPDSIKETDNFSFCFEP